VEEENRPENKVKKSEVIIAIVLVTLFLGFFVKEAFNKAVVFDEDVKKQFAQIDTELSRRYDIIPLLQKTSERYAKHELDVMEAVASGRKQYITASTMEDKLNAMRTIESSLARLLVIFERYPDLLADRVFMKVMDTIEDTANRITATEQVYNEKVFALNAYKRSVEGFIPSKIAQVSNASYMDFSAIKQKEK
jgi:LemA protein